VIWSFIVLLTIRLLCPNFAVLSPSYFSKNIFHQSCLEWLRWRDLDSVYGGLFCGDSNLDPSLQTLFQSSGLYHLLVVSGAHLVFLEKIIQKIFPGWEKSKLLLFLCFALTCEFSAPIVRAVFSQIFTLISEQRRLFLRDDARVLLSGLACLVLFPEWIYSYSLLLSWMASLALVHPWSGWKKHAVIAAYLVPWTQTLQPASVFNNFVFGLVFEYFLFPVSAICFATPGLTKLGNSLWEITNRSITLLPSLPPSPQPQDHLVYWAFIFALHLAHRSKK